MRGLYIHIPFCVRKCAYCDFYSLPDRLDCLDAYLEAVLREARKYAGLSFETVYLGGGTPSLLGPYGITRLLSGLRQIFDLTPLTEATTEANPDSATLEFLAAARAAGINRLSLGVQSLSDAELQKVGRVHTAAQAMEAIDRALRAGFENISADGILGLPGQDWQSLMVTLETLAGQDIRHLSLYCLSIEPNTPLAQNQPPDLPSDDAQADLYTQAVTLLAERGLEQYEISNFAVPGWECRHNLNYWRGGEYLGLGPAAASHLDGRRFKNRPDLESYLKDPGGQTEEMEELPPVQKAAEEALLRLRLLKEGLDIQELAEKYGDENVIAVAARVNQLARAGSLRRNGPRYFLPPDKALVSNSILAEIVG